MKKFTKRILAFVLATAMVVAGVPMSAKEVKAADDTFILDFGMPTDGIVSPIDGTIGPVVHSTSTTYGTQQLTTSLKGNGWTLNTEKTTIPKAETDETLYLADASLGAVYHSPKSNKSNFSSELESAYLMSLRLGNGNAIAFDFTAPSAGEYQMQVLYVVTGRAPATVTVNDTVFEGLMLGEAGGSGNEDYKTETVKVTLNEGTNTIVVSTDGDSYYSGLRAVYFTKLETPEYASATLNLVDGTEFNVGDTFELSTTATMTDGTDISGDISVVYTSSNTNVATVEGNALSIVGAGVAKISAAVSYGGELKETLVSNIVATVADTFTLDFTEVDTTTIANDGSNRLYFTETTKSTETAATQWMIDVENSHADAIYPKTGLRYWHSSLVPTYLRVMTSGSKESVIKFTAPEAGTYNVVVNTLPFDSGGYLKVYVNDNYVGTVDGYTGQSEVQLLLAADLVAGDYANTISFETAGTSNGSKYYFNLYSFDFVPAGETPRVVTGLTASINGADSATFDLSETIEAQASATVTATDGVVVWPTYTSDNTDVVKVGATSGTVTLVAAGEANIIATAGDYSKTLAVKVVDARKTVTWVNEDGTVLETDKVVVGETPTYDGETPAKAEDAYATYTFAGWDKEVVAVTEDVTYTATYEATAKTYSVTWVVDGVESSEVYEAGKTPEFKGSTDKAADEQYEYTFTGWTPELVEVTEDITYTAQYDQSAIKYTVTWVGFDGTELGTEELDYGIMPEYKGETPVFELDGVGYDFTGWDKTITAVTENVTYTAVHDYDGIYEGYYYVDGKIKQNAGVVQIGEDLYYVCYSGKIAAGRNQTVAEGYTNGLVEAGTYFFFADGRMQNPADDLKGEIRKITNEKTGVEELWYYVKDEVRKNVGLVKVGDYFYYVLYSGKVKVAGNQTLSADKLNGLEEEAGVEGGKYYYFFGNGRLKTDVVKKTMGEIRDGQYYIFDELVKDAGLVQIGDYYYYVLYSGKVKVNGNQTIVTGRSNGFDVVTEGKYYRFNEVGQLTIGGQVVVAE